VSTMPHTQHQTECGTVPPFLSYGGINLDRQLFNASLWKIYSLSGCATTLPSYQGTPNHPRKMCQDPLRNSEDRPPNYCTVSELRQNKHRPIVFKRQFFIFRSRRNSTNVSGCIKSIPHNCVTTPACNAKTECGTVPPLLRYAGTNLDQ
jgi:hypothetical protein